MKASRILILILIIIAIGAYWFTTRPPADNLPATDEIEAQTVTNGEMRTEPIEEATVSDETMDMGTDVGMEMPIPDDTEMNVPSDAKIFAIRGENFMFDIKEIRVRKGDTVVINFKSTDGFHDFVIDAFNARTNRVQTGGETQVTFIADEAGTYEYYCSVGNHRANGMTGKLIVE